jgi:RNA methyltransferase, TrmH family
MRGARSIPFDALEDNPLRLLSLARDLRRRKARERLGLFVAEGIRVVEELVEGPIETRGVLVGPALAATPRGLALRERLVRAGHTVVDVGEADFASAADTDSPQGILAIAEQPRVGPEALAQRLDGPARLLVLDALQDPGNAGTMLRTAAALGATAVVALPGTVDLWSAKVVRGALGAHFRLPAVHVAWEPFAAVLRDWSVALWGADMAGDPVDTLAPAAPDRLAIAVGNEGAGLSDVVAAHADRLVSIPIAPGVESLNAGVAAGILLYALARRPAAAHAS